MKEFFNKHGGKQEDPYEAIEILSHKLHEVKDKVAQGDPSHIKDLSDLSDMIEDYVRATKGHDFKPVQKGADYRNLQSKRPGGSNVQNGMGYIYPMYPSYPYYENDPRNGGQGSGRDYRDDFNRGGGQGYFPEHRQGGNQGNDFDDRRR